MAVAVEAGQEVDQCHGLGVAVVQGRPVDVLVAVDRGVAVVVVPVVTVAQDPEVEVPSPVDLGLVLGLDPVPGRVVVAAVVHGLCPGRVVVLAAVLVHEV